MAKKVKQKKSQKKAILDEIEGKLAETVKGYSRKTSEKKFKKNLHKAGKILSRSLTKDQITVVHKEKPKTAKKEKKEAKVEMS
jgi:hypothetical protein